MKKEFNPTVEIIDISDDVIVTSSCFETHACVSCYCSGVQCGGTYTCNNYSCPTYDELYGGND